MLVVDLSQVDPAIRTKMDEIFRRDHEVQLLAAMKEQRRMAAEFERERPRSTRAMGEQTMALHPYIDACNRAIVGSHRWSNDHDLRKWYLKKYPEARVRSRGTKEIQVGYRAPQPTDRTERAGLIIASSGGNKRYTKVYA
jgi:hypothetical protein